MRQCFLSLALVCGVLVSQAQLRLRVEGDGQIEGTLSVTEDVYVSDRLLFPNFSVYIGSQSRANNNDAINNTFVGFLTGRFNEAIGNTFIGSISGNSNVIGTQNTFVGWNSGPANTDGSENTLIGTSAGSDNTTGDFNTMVGKSAGERNIDGSENTYLGHRAALQTTSGNQNTLIGAATGLTIQTGVGNTMLGYGAGSSSGVASLENAIAIGYLADVGCNNCAVIGGTGVNAVRVGMGINDNLSARLSLYNASSGSNPQLSLIEEDAGNFSRLKFENADLAGHWILAARGNAAGIPRFNFFYNNESGMGANIMSLDGTFFNIGMGTVNPDAGAKLDVFGDIYINGAFHASDRRFKKNIRNIDQPLNLLDNLRGVSYEFRTDQFGERFSEGRHYGLIAQELEQVLPELVRDRDDGYKVVNYEGLIPVLIEGLKAQQDEIKELRQLVEDLIARQSDQNNSNQELILEDTGSLGQNYPNPFHRNTQVDYYLPTQTQTAYLQVSGVDGKVLGKITIQERGRGKVTIKAGTYPAGTYFYSLVIDGEVIDTRKMILTR